MTTRIMNRAKEMEDAYPEAEPVQADEPAPPVAPAKTAEMVEFKTPVERLSQSKTTYQQRVTQDRRQLSLF